jgi:hypothetical protein
MVSRQPAPFLTTVSCSRHKIGLKCQISSRTTHSVIESWKLWQHNIIYVTI